MQKRRKKKMEYQVDHDYHIHSKLSSCSSDPEQTPARLLAYAQEQGLKEICVTDHFWDEKVQPCLSGWYAVQDYAHIRQSLLLPQAEGVRFAFGCETEFSGDLRLGISRERMEELDFVIVPTTHLHMTEIIPASADAAARAKAWETRLEALLSMDLPFHKIGIAHLACPLIMRGTPLNEVLDLIPDDVYHRLFAKAAKLGAGIELNASDVKTAGRTPAHIAAVERLFRTAREEGCRFYLGSDAHHPASLDAAPALFRAFVSKLGLTEENKFHPFARADA